MSKRISSILLLMSLYTLITLPVLSAPKTTITNTSSANLVTFINGGTAVDFKQGVKIFTDRRHKFKGTLPSELDGQTLLVTLTSSTKVKFNKNCKVWALCGMATGGAKIVKQAKDMGFKDSNIADFTLFGGRWGNVKVMEKKVKVGETLIFGDWVRLVAETNHKKNDNGWHLGNPDKRQIKDPEKIPPALEKQLSKEKAASSKK